MIRRIGGHVSNAGGEQRYHQHASHWSNASRFCRQPSDVGALAVSASVTEDFKNS